MQRGVHDDQVARGLRRDDVDDVGQVALEHLVVERLPAVVGQGHVQGPLDARDLGSDVDVGRRHDLRAVTEIDLVAVVLRRVVARRDHDARVSAEVPNRIRENGCGQRPRQHRGAPTGTEDDRSGVTSEDVGVEPRVETDDDKGLRDCLLQVCRDAGCRSNDD